MIWVNGVKTEHIAASDRGLHYGDGVWETIVIKAGKAQFWHEHLQRLQTGLDALGIDFNIACLDQDLLLVRTAYESQQSYVLKIIVTRGSGGRGYAPPKQVAPNRIISLHPMPHYPEHFYHDGVDVMLCKTRLAHHPQLAGFKHLNRLEQVLARQELDADHFEGLVMDYSDNIVEGTMSNVFIVKDNTLLTPDLSQCGIKGIMRNAVIEALQAQQLKVQKETKLSVEQVEQADAVFLTNSVIGILPVRSFNGEQYDPQLLRSYFPSLRDIPLC